MLIGGDISHHNYPFQVGFGEFQIYKATEGKSFIDTKLADYCSQIKAEDLIAFYHYARPENNSADEEAQHFVEVVRPYIGKAIFILDWEGVALKFSQEWALEWLRKVYIKTGVKPILYTSSSQTKYMKKIADNGYELWVAHYEVKAPRVYNWTTWRMWQFANKPFDVDLFNGTEEDWKRLCRISME